MAQATRKNGIDKTLAQPTPLHLSRKLTRNNRGYSALIIDVTPGVLNRILLSVRRKEAIPKDHYHHRISFMQLTHLLARSGLTYPEVSSKVYHDSFYQSDSSVSLPWVIYFEAFYLHVVSSFSCIPVICPKLLLFLTPSQFVHLFCNLSKCILLFFSCISSLLLLFFWRHLL